MAANPQCPLDPFKMRQLKNQMNFAHVLEIENHVSSGSCLHPPLKDIVLHGNVTPLLLACKEGHLDSVQHIVDVWGADVRAAGNYHHGLREKATPLFVAALERHTEIVRFLITKNADVSAITSTENQTYSGLTPLHGSLMPSNFFPVPSVEYVKSNNDIVNLLLEAGGNPSTLSAVDGTPVWGLPFCGVGATIALVKHGLDVNQPSRFRQILHRWIEIDSPQDSPFGITEEERLLVVQFLLDHVADLNGRDHKGFSPILTSAEFKRFGILELLLERGEIDVLEKIDAIELAGARLLSSEPEKAFHYWREALLLRNKKGHDPIKKIPLQMMSERAAEWVTLDDLEAIKEDPSVYLIQAVVTRLRIYGGRGCEAVIRFTNKELEPFSSLYSNNYNEQSEKKAPRTDIQDLMLGILRVLLRFKPFGYDFWNKPWNLTRTLVYELAVSFNTSEMDGPLLDSKFQRIKTSLQLITEVDPDGLLFKAGPKVGFFEMLAILPDHLLLDKQFKDIREYASRTARLEAGTLLYHACRCEDWKTLRLLLHLGADAKATVNALELNEVGGYLHLVAGREEDPIRTDAANLLFAYGAQPNRTNFKGKTAVDIWTEKNCGGEGVQSPAWDTRPYWCRETVPKLLCLASKTIHTNSISYNKLPTILQTFVEDH